MGVVESKPASSLHVVRVTPGSLAMRAGFLPVFHYITAVNGAGVRGEEDIAEVLDAWKRGRVVLDVYDSRLKETVQLTLAGKEEARAETLGFGVKHHQGEKRPVVFKILKTEFNSPAISAGLREEQDFIIGWEGGAFESENALEHFLLSHVGRQVCLLVYNVGMSSVRKATVVPGSARAGDGLLGCDLGTGILNEIPSTPGRVYLEAEGEAEVRARLEEVTLGGAAEGVDARAAPEQEPAPVQQAPGPEQEPELVQQEQEQEQVPVPPQELVQQEQEQGPEPEPESVTESAQQGQEQEHETASVPPQEPVQQEQSQDSALRAHVDYEEYAPIPDFFVQEKEESGFYVADGAYTDESGAAHEEEGASAGAGGSEPAHAGEPFQTDAGRAEEAQSFF